MAILLYFMPFYQKKSSFSPSSAKNFVLKLFLIFLTTNDQNLPMNLSFPGNIFFPIKSLVSFAFI